MPRFQKQMVRWFLKMVVLFTLLGLIFVLRIGTKVEIVENSNASVPSSVNASTYAVCPTENRVVVVNNLCRLEGWRKDPISQGRLCRNLIVSDRHKLVYCDIPKCGSKSFKTLIGRLTRDDFVTSWSVRMGEYRNKTGIRMFCDLLEPERRKVLRDYYKFVVVRHPFDRLMSAWEHKLSEPGKSHALNGVLGVVEHYFKEKRINNGTFRLGSDALDLPSFLELVSTKYDQNFRNPHWDTFYEHCQPCHIKYDAIYKLETLTDDIQQLYGHIRDVSEAGSVPVLGHTNNERRAVDDKLAQVSQLYREIDRDTVERLLRVYARDMAMFGYSWSLEHGAGCSLNAESGTCC